MWERRTPLAWLLWPVAVVFGLLVALRRLAYRAGFLARERVGCPVIVVGNLRAGGSGKTPLALWLAHFLASKGWTPGIVSRGYGGRLRGIAQVTAQSDPSDVGDEPLLLARRAGCPVWVGADRVGAARALRARHPEVDVLVLDDGLQHYRLARDIELAVVDRRGFGNGFLLPAGPLRETPARLHTVDAVIAHDTERVAGVAMRLEGDRLQCLADPRETRPLAELADQRVHAVAGIGDPARFFAALEARGLRVVPHAFPDHHRYRAEDLRFGDDAPVVMTEKDAVKCARFADPRCWVLPVDAVLDPAFGAWLMEKLGGPKAA